MIYSVLCPQLHNPEVLITSDAAIEDSTRSSPRELAVSAGGVSTDILIPDAQSLTWVQPAGQALEITSPGGGRGGHEVSKEEQNSVHAKQVWEIVLHAWTAVSNPPACATWHSSIQHCHCPPSTSTHCHFKNEPYAETIEKPEDVFLYLMFLMRFSILGINVI